HSSGVQTPVQSSVIWGCRNILFSVPWAVVRVQFLGGQKSFRKVLFISFCPQNVLVNIVLDLGFDFRTQGFNYFGGGSQDQGIGRNDHALWHHGVGTNDAVFANVSMV
ncbi:MAG: hypothetical protein RIQ91_996, partial [Bacteroidota bacterium]